MEWAAPSHPEERILVGQRFRNLSDVDWQPLRVEKFAAFSIRAMKYGSNPENAPNEEGPQHEIEALE